MSPLRRRRWIRTLALLPVALLIGCTENDEQLVESVGVTRLLLVDSGQRGQSLASAVGPVQATEWELDQALLDFDGSLVDVLYGELCSVVDTVFISPRFTGACSSGVASEGSDTEVFTVDLLLSVTSMRVRRGEPLDLSATQDYDGDGVPNDGDGSGNAFDAPCGLGGVTSSCDDNCPLVPNEDQADNNGDGIGNACTFNDPLFGPFPDSDADGVVDGIDDCVWVPNPNQADTMGLGQEGIQDGIGDACTEQVADVLPFQLDLEPTDLVQMVGETTYVTVDFDSSTTLICDWESGTCTLDPAKVELCTFSDLSSALGGC